MIARMVGLARKGTSVVIGGNVIVHVARIASTVLLTRLLAPGDFGIAGLIASLCTILVLISDLGFYAFLVRHPRGEEREFLDQVWTVRVVRGLVITLVMLAAAGPIAEFIDQPEMRPVIAFSAIYLFVGALASLSFATAARAGQVSRLVALDTVPALAQIALAIVIAYFIPNYWAIVFAMLASGIMKTSLSYLFFPGSGRRFNFNGSTARELWTFGRYIAASSAIHLAITQADKVILADTFTLAELGLYMLAANIAAAPGLVFGSYSSRILYPLFAKAHAAGSGALAKTYYAAGRHLRLLYQIVAGGFVACAPLIIQILYNRNYAGAAVYLQILALTALFKLSVAAANECLLAAGHARHVFRLNVAKAVWLIIAFVVLGSAYGGIGIVVAVATVDLAAQIYSWWALKREGVLSFGEEWLLWAATFIGFGIGYAVNWGALEMIRIWLA